jgi:hypothetical protein
LSGLATACLVGVVTDGVPQLLSDLAELATLAEAADALEEAEAAEAPAVTCCFAAGTPVHTKRGIVPVEKINVGDLVLSRNRETGKLEYKKVTALTKPHLDKLLEMRLQGEIKPLHPTADHPFWVKRGGAKDGDWIEAGKMRTGDLVLSIQGAWRKVLSITLIPGQQTVYNFEVDDDHDYFVGTEGVLVHNSYCFWSGKGSQSVAESWAGGQTLSVDSSAGPEAVAAASQVFAENASGVVDVFQPLENGGVPVQGLWGNVEYPALMGNPNVTGFTYRLFDGSGNIVQTIFVPK